MRYYERDLTTVTTVTILGVAGNDPLDLRLRSTGQVEQVVAPVGGGRLVDRAPHQAAGLGRVRGER